MKTNILIMVIIGALTYLATIAMETRKPAPQAITTPSHIEQTENTPTLKVQTLPKAQTPIFSFEDIHAQTHNIEDFKGRLILLNFWASWCPPCIKEFPHLIEIAEQFSDQITLIALSSDHDKEAMMRFVNKLDLEGKSNILIALDEEQKITKVLFGTYKLPETILITPEQIMHSKVIGGDWKKQEMENHIKLLLSNIKNST